MRKTNRERTVFIRAKIIKKMLLSVLFLLLFGLVKNADASSAGSHEAARISSLVWPVINFCIYAFLMNFLYRKFGKPAIIARAVEFEQTLIKADSYLEEVEKEHRALQNRLKNIQIEEEEIRTRISNETEFEINSLVSAAEYAAKQTVGDVQRRIAQEITKVNAEVKFLVVTQAMKKAEEKLKSSLSKEQDYTLRQNTVRSLIN